MKLLVACVLVLGLSCGGGTTRRDPPVVPVEASRLLAYVPADTPYLIAALEPPPPQLRRYMQRGFEGGIAGFLASTANISADARRELPAWTRVRIALVDELRGKPPTQWWSTLGLDVGAAFVVYGVGPWPVIRLQVADAVRVRQVLERALAQANAKPVRVEGQMSWTISIGELELVVAVIDRKGTDPAHLSLSIAPPTSKSRVLSAAPNPLLGSNVLADLAQRHRLSRVLHGYFDLRQTIAVLGSTTLEAPLRDAIAPVIASCGTELDRVANAFPRFVFGYRNVDDVHFDATFVLEAPTQLTAGLAKLRTAVPGVLAAQTTPSIFAFGVAVDIAGFAAWAKDIVRDLRAQPFACPVLAWINDAARTVDELLQSPVLQLVQSLRGFAVAIDEVDPAVPSITGDVLVVGNNVGNILSLVTAMVPQLSNLAISPNGEAVELPSLGIPWVTSAHVALRDDRLAVGFGRGSHDRVRTQLTAKTPPHSPFAVFTGDGKRLQRFLELVSPGNKDDDRTDDVGVFSMHLDVTDAGIAIDVLGSW